MTAATTGDGRIELSSEEAAYLRQVLLACSQLLTWASRHGGPDVSQPLAEVTAAAAGGRSPGGLLYDLNLAIDHLDFAPAARSTR
jgi:hypothetical protein